MMTTGEFRNMMDNIIMEAQTRPRYNEFLKQWSKDNSITSFFGSDKSDFLKDWSNVKTGGAKMEPVVAPVVEKTPEPVVEPTFEEPVKKKSTKVTITFSEADKKKMEGMTRNERINYGIRLSKKNAQINRVVDMDLFDFAKELRSGGFKDFFSGIIKGSLTPQNKYFKMMLLRLWASDNKKKIVNIDKMLVGELNNALEVKGIDVNELFKIGKKYFE